MARLEDWKITAEFSNEMLEQIRRVIREEISIPVTSVPGDDALSWRDLPRLTLEELHGLYLKRREALEMVRNSLDSRAYFIRQYEQDVWHMARLLRECREDIRDEDLIKRIDSALEGYGEE